MVHLTLETEQKRLTVVLGPNWYMAQQGWNINALDRLEVTGSSLQLDGKPTLLAQEVKKGAQLMKFGISKESPYGPLPGVRHSNLKDR